MLAVVLGTLGPTAALNLAIDPYATWGRPTVTAQSMTFLQAPRGRQLAWLHNRLRASAADTWLLGSSRILVGIDTCAIPNVERFALLHLELTELQAVLDDVLPRASAPKRVLMEWALGPSEPPPFPEPWDLHRELLALDTTRVSAANLALVVGESLGGGTPTRPCQARASSEELSLAGLDAFMDFMRAVDPDVGPAVRAAWSQTFARACSTHEHEIVFFLAPVYASVTTADQVRQLVSRHAESARTAVAEFAAAAPACRFEFIDLATPYLEAYPGRGIEPRPADWQNVGHFRGELGAQVLRELI